MLGDTTSNCGTNPCTFEDFLTPWSLGAPCAAYMGCLGTGITPSSDVNNVPSLVPYIGQSGTGIDIGFGTGINDNSNNPPDNTPNYMPLIIAGIAVIGIMVFFKK